MAKISNGVVLPAEVKSEGSLNGGVPTEDRMTPSRPTLSDGPEIGERGEYLARAYETRPGIIRIDR